MRRKNRKWVATAVVLYLCVMWSAYWWGTHQRLPDGTIFEHIEKERKRKLIEEMAKEAAAQPKQAVESRLTAAGPAFVAARYDANHVVFMLADETESRFATSPGLSGAPAKIPSAPKAVAPLAGLQELWEPDSHALHFFPEIIQKTKPGDQWVLSLSADSTIPVTVERTVVAPTGCTLALGFLAAVPPDQRPAFAESSREYFVVRRTAVESANPPATSHVAELPNGKLFDGKMFDTVGRQMEQQLNERMKQELANIDARLIANSGSPGATAGESPVGNARPLLKEWIHADQGLTRGEGTLDYDYRLFRITPDAAPRLFVRARWMLAGAPVFLMTAWFRADVSKPESSAERKGTNVKLVLLSADSSWSAALREGSTGTLGDSLDFENILNEFDSDHDGWAELLIHSYDAHSYDTHSDRGNMSTIALYLYTDLGLVPLKTPLRRDNQPPASCVDP